MTLRFLIPGKLKETYLVNGTNDYLKRLSKYAKVSIQFLIEERINNPASKEEINKALDKEAIRNLKLIKDDDILFLVDYQAKEVTSEQLAYAIKDKSAKSGNLVFLFGSSYGLSDLARKRASYSFSLSKMTFTHYLTYFLTLEQVYRAFKINNGETYDK